MTRLLALAIRNGFDWSQMTGETVKIMGIETIREMHRDVQIQFVRQELVAVDLFSEVLARGGLKGQRVVKKQMFLDVMGFLPVPQISIRSKVSQ